jgi:hypothetical protein
MVRFFLFFLGLLSFLSALTLGGCTPTLLEQPRTVPEPPPTVKEEAHPKGLGTFTMGDQTTVLTHSYAALQSDKNDPKQNFVVVLLTDRPVAVADRQPSRLTPLAKSKKLHALRLIWRSGFDDVRVVLYHPEIIASGLAFRGQSILNITALNDRHIEAEVRSKKLGQDWAFTVKFKADLVKGGVVELEPLAGADASGKSASGDGKGSGKGSSSQRISELGRLGYEFTDDDFFEAMGKGDLRAMRLFLSAGMSPNVRSRTGDSALMMAIGSCSTPPVREHNSIALVLIEAKADVNFRNNIRVTPLIQAADKCEPEVIQALINAGAEVNARAAGGGTALLMAEVLGKTENAKILRKAGGAR